MDLVWLTDTVTRDLSSAVHNTLLWGLEGMELRTVGGPSDRVPHVDESMLLHHLRENDLPVEAVVPGLFQGRTSGRPVWLNELTLLDDVLRFCARIGCSRVVVSAFAESESPEAAAEPLRRAGEKAKSEDVTLAVLNESDAAHPTGRALAKLLHAVDHPNVRAAWRPASAVEHGESPGEGLAALGEPPALVRVSDGLLRGGTWTEKPPGRGAVGWPEHLEALREASFDGPLSLEVNVEPKAKQGVRSASRLVRWRRSLDG
jgi:sugar phosphate isomerase/epimerase